LSLAELPYPHAAENDVVVRVHAAGMTSGELEWPASWTDRAGRDRTPSVPGHEVSGVVDALGYGTTGLTVGQRVFGLTDWARNGTLAEYVAVEARNLAPLPAGVDHAVAAASVISGLTAWQGLFDHARVMAGQTVLVHGAAGGVGTAALQVAKGLGARTIAVVSSDDKERVAREAGADEVVRSDGAWKDEAKELSGGGVDVVIDPVGGDRFTDSLRSLGEAGRLVVVGFTGGSIPEVRVNRLLLNNTEVVGAGWGAFVMGKPDVNREIGAEVNRLVDEGFVRPIVGARFPLERAGEALELIDGRGATGKVVLDIR
jgi:NADPH:quinone reductase